MFSLSSHFLLQFPRCHTFKWQWHADNDDADNDDADNDDDDDEEKTLEHTDQISHYKSSNKCKIFFAR